jgi:hypothetical protein
VRIAFARALGQPAMWFVVVAASAMALLGVVAGGWVGWSLTGMMSVVIGHTARQLRLLHRANMEPAQPAV